MIFLLFFITAFAQDQKILWSKKFPAAPSAVYFEPNAQKVYAMIPAGAESELVILDKSGNVLSAGKKVKGEGKKIFSFDSRIFFATENELISFDPDLEKRKKVRNLPIFNDLNMNHKGELLTAEKDGVYLWTGDKKVRISEKNIGALFFDLFEIMGVDNKGTVWNLSSAKKAGFRFSKACKSVWRYNDYWLCISPDTVERADLRFPLLSFSEKPHGFAFGYQKEEKDIFWLLALKNEVRAVSPVFRK